MNKQTLLCRGKICSYKLMRKCLDLPLLQFLGFGVGCLNCVFSRERAAAACCAFLMDGPEAMQSSLSPIFRHTVKFFLCAGPDSSVSLYWCWIQNSPILQLTAGLKKARKFADNFHTLQTRYYVSHICGFYKKKIQGQKSLAAERQTKYLRKRYL